MSGIDDLGPVVRIQPSKPPKRRDEDGTDAEPPPRPARKRPPPKRQPPRERPDLPHVDDYA